MSKILERQSEPAGDQPGFSAESPWRRFVADFFASKVATGAFIVLVLIIVIALFAPLISPQNPYDSAVVDILDSRLPPGEQSTNGQTVWLGTDGAGRDLLSAILYGLRTSLGVGVMSGFIALCVGAGIGLAAVYFGGIVDTLIMRIVNLQLSFPAILVALIPLVVLGKGVDNIIIALVIAQWPYYARTLRGGALAERRKDYVAAATCLALSYRRIVFRHVLPNCLPLLLVVGAFQTAHSIVLEATFSFLGIGLPVTQPSLGLLIASGFEDLSRGHYWISFFPGVALLLIIFSINLVGDRWRDVLSPGLSINHPHDVQSVA